jgi:hypothetical protein
LAPSSLPTITPQPTPCVDSDAPVCSYISRGRSHVFCDVISIATSCRLTCGWC